MRDILRRQGFHEDIKYGPDCMIKEINNREVVLIVDRNCSFYDPSTHTHVFIPRVHVSHKKEEKKQIQEQKTVRTRENRKIAIVVDNYD